MIHAEVQLWGTRIGAISYQSENNETAVFQYDDSFVADAVGIEPAPLLMPRRRGLHSFANLSNPTFHGLPGLVVDSLPDRFGTGLLDSWFASTGRDPAGINTIERLLYMADRGMGALTFAPPRDLGLDETPHGLDLRELGELANLVIQRDTGVLTALKSPDLSGSALDLIRVGTSAGGARAKALVALNADGDLRPGHRIHSDPHSYWLLKFDGVAENGDRDGTDPAGMTVVEYIYSIIARNCGIRMPECRIIPEGDNRHFMVERFDRVTGGQRTDRVHYASWCGIAHAHRDWPGAYGYEQLALACRQLGLPHDDLRELFRRAVFNVVGVNHDDHTKNFGFLMDRGGRWRLSPAFDLTYAFDPAGAWTRAHQTSLNGKTSDHTMGDLLSFGPHCNVSDRDAAKMIEEVRDSFSRWPSLAKSHDVPKNLSSTIDHILNRTARCLETTR